MHNLQTIKHIYPKVTVWQVYTPVWLWPWFFNWLFFWYLLIYLAAPHRIWDPSSLTRDWTALPAFEAWSHNHRTTREVLTMITYISITPSNSVMPLCSKFSPLTQGNYLYATLFSSLVDRGAWWATVHRVAKSRLEFHITRISFFRIPYKWHHTECTILWKWPILTRV